MHLARSFSMLREAGLAFGLAFCAFVPSASADPAQTEPFTLAIEAPAARPGQSATARVELKPAAGYHINKDFPTSLRLVAPAGVELPKPTLKKADGQVSE